MTDPLLPNKGLLETVGVKLLAPLGGRLNQHWLVEGKHGRFVLRRWADVCSESFDYETRLLFFLANGGWPVPYLVGESVKWEGSVWSMAAFLPGEPSLAKNSIDEQRLRGRLLAQLHASLKQYPEEKQRGKWRRCEQILGDAEIDRVLSKYEGKYPEEVGLLRWHLERARARIEGLNLGRWEGQVVHGDFTTWNLLFECENLSGILDFELAHFDHRIADFALSWRGMYDEVVHGYNEVAPLTPEEWEALTPMWWAFLIEQACRALVQGEGADEWSLRQLVRRSPLMGADAVPFK